MKKLLILLLWGVSFLVSGQTPAAKEITTKDQSWFSINSTLRFSPRWGMIGDFHVRRDNFLKDDFFYFLRVGGVYWVADKYPVIAGVAHLWLAPPPGMSTWSNENRIYEQWSAVTRQGRVAMLNRIRLEQRWRDNIVNDEVVGPKQFSLRLRYLASCEIRVFNDPRLPSTIISDEVLVQFGHAVVSNSFDQNRLFLGIKIPLSNVMSCDIGYMNILQQKTSGYQYDLSHVFRLFFYYNLDFSKKEGNLDAIDHAE